MKNNLKITLFLLVLISSMSIEYSSNLTNNDFGNFTMNVPEDASFKEESVPMIMALFADKLSSGDLSSKSETDDPKYNHPVWTEENTNMSIGYYDFNEDKINSIQSLMQSEYNGAYPVESDDNVKIYDISDCKLYTKNNTYMAVKIKEGFLFWEGDAMVTISGSDKDELKQMANSIKFK